MLYKPGITEHLYAIYAGDYRAYVCYISPGLQSNCMLYKLRIIEHTYALHTQDNIMYICSIQAAFQKNSWGVHQPPPPNAGEG